jgi:hypothetical protein
MTGIINRKKLYKIIDSYKKICYNEIKDRKMKKLCLKCGEPFDSQGKHNRFCCICRQFIREYGFYFESTKVHLDLDAIRPKE